MNKQILATLKVSALAIVLSFGISYALAWTAPTTTPPGGNVAAPVNTGSIDQTKTGDLCTSKGGTTKCLSSAQLAVPVITFTPISATIQNGQTSTFSWVATNTDTSSSTPCTASGSWSGAKPATGSFTTSALSGPATYTYALSCNGPGGTSQQSTTVQVIVSGSVTYSNGTGGWYTLPYGVNTITFNASGGNGGYGWAYGGGAGAYDGGGGGAFAATAAGPIIYVGGGGGGAVGAGGAGGTTAGNGAGQGGNGYWGAYVYGQNGSVGSGGKGGSGGVNGTWPGGAGGVGNTTNGGATGGTGTADPLGGGAGGLGGNGGSGGVHGGNYSPTTGAAGGGGGYGGGGGGGADDVTFSDNGSGTCCYYYGSSYMGSGGGGGSYAVAGMSAPSASGRSILLSAIGNPTQIYLQSGAKGVGFSGNGGSAGTITMSW